MGDGDGWWDGGGWPGGLKWQAVTGNLYVPWWWQSGGRVGKGGGDAGPSTSTQVPVLGHV